MIYSVSTWLAKSRRHLAMVVPIAVREWRTSVFSKVFVGLGVGYPLLISSVLWLAVLGLVLVKNLEGNGEFPELRRQIEQLLGANIPIVPTTYYVVDNSDSQIGELIRNEILRRDITKVVEFISGKDVAEFARVLPLINPYMADDVEESTVRLKERLQAVGGETQKTDSFVAVLVESINFLGRGIGEANEDHDARNFANWWIANAEYLGHAVPDISLRSFSELVDEDITLENLDELVALKKVHGYFILPRGISQSNTSIEFVTSELTDSLERRSALLLKNWYEEIATGVLETHRNVLVESDSVGHSLPVIASVLVTPIKSDKDNPTAHAHAFFEWGAEPRYLNLWVRSIWIALFWIAMFNSVYAMSFNTTEEKQSRIAEVLLSSVSCLHLMDGKVFGNVLVILTVCGSWMVILGLPMVWLIALAPELGSYALRELFNPIYILNWFVLLLLGLTMLGYVLTALGALFSTERVMSMVNSVLLVLFVIGLITTLDPYTTLASVVRFIPPLTPFTLVSQTTALPTPPIYFALLAIVIMFLWSIRYFWVVVFARGIFLNAVPSRLSRLTKALLTQQ